MTYPGKRQVLLFYNAQGIATKTEQLNILEAQKEGLAERDIEIHSYILSEHTDEAQKWKASPEDPFTFILVGKDGTEKMRSQTVVSTEKLFSTIDAMPMRKREMKEKH